MAESDYIAHLEKAFGKSWVIARKTERSMRQYGPNANFITNAQYKKAQREFRMVHGMEYEPTRAAMYQALLFAQTRLADSIGFRRSELLNTVRSAIAAEQATF